MIAMTNMTLLFESSKRYCQDKKYSHLVDAETGMVSRNDSPKVVLQISGELSREKPGNVLLRRNAS